MNGRTDTALAGILPCPFCGDPMAVKMGQFAHVVQTPGCPARDLGWAVERAADWNQRAALKPAGEVVGRVPDNPKQIPPFISAVGFDDRNEERAVINGCLYLRADFAAARYRPAPTSDGVREKVCKLIESYCPQCDDHTGIALGHQVERLADLIFAALSADRTTIEAAALERAAKALVALLRVTSPCDMAKGRCGVPNFGNELDALEEALKGQQP